jgi:hypothetical protein
MQTDATNVHAKRPATACKEACNALPPREKKNNLKKTSSTRFAHLGIMATLFHRADVGIDNSTVFIVENDFWEDKGRRRNTYVWLLTKLSCY